MCLADTCEVARQNAWRPVAELGKAGKALWAGATEFEELTATQRSLLLEACRITDTLEDLQGLMADPDERKWAIREARQQRGVLKNLLSELRHSGASGGSGEDESEDAPPAPPDGQGEEKESDVSDLVARIEEKRQASAHGGT